jgi:hypothetical protein
MTYFKTKLKSRDYKTYPCFRPFLDRKLIRQMDLGEIGWDGSDWIELAQDRDKWRALVNTMMNLRVP